MIGLACRTWKRSCRAGGGEQGRACRARQVTRCLRDTRFAAQLLLVPGEEHLSGDNPGPSRVLANRRQRLPACTWIEGQPQLLEQLLRLARHDGRDTVTQKPQHVGQVVQYGSQALASLCQVLYSSNRFLYLE